jgi:hypothetical protein
MAGDLSRGILLAFENTRQAAFCQKVFTHSRAGDSDAINQN